jgi:formamidase
MIRTHRLSVDPLRPLAEQPGKGHNRWHEAIPPALEVEPGEPVALETWDALDAQLTPQSTIHDVAEADLSRVHPLTGPVFVKGAQPGDLLEVKLQAIEPDPWQHWGYTVQVPGFGFLRDQFPQPYIVHWHLYDTYAESPQLPGVRIPRCPHPGTIGVALSRELREAVARREAELAARGGFALLPDPTGAVPASEPIASEGLRTIPPRENAGNLDIKQLTPGASIFIPVWVEGALFSVGDVHFAQGDGEVCGTAIEMRSVVHVEFRVHKGEARRRGIRTVQFLRDGYFTAPEMAAPRRFYATTGICVRNGRNESEDLTLAARDALFRMIEYLQRRGFTAQQAYALCSVAVDLRVSETVDVPNVMVSAILPLDIFVE